VRLRWSVSAFVLLLVISTPAFGYLAVGSVEWMYDPLDERPEDVEALVVLGGGVWEPDEVRSRAELDASSLYRCLAVARLYKQGRPCPILVSGGKPDPSRPGPAAADLMADLLIELGVRPSDLLVENKSRTTYENAAESKKLLEERGIGRIVLVTEATHLHRAVLCFRKQGLEVIPSGCHQRKTRFEPSLFAFLPGPGGLDDVETACHEWVGLAWYRLAGRI
jgi:uncharacterized SAM-binding protein YcdF (DUF218 family)